MIDCWNWMFSLCGEKDSNSVDVDDVVRKEEKHVRLPPLLLTIHDDLENQSFYNLLDNRCQITRLPVLTKKSVLCSAYGWLVLLDFSEGDLELGGCCLWNPATMEIIDLPNLGDPYLYSNCVLSNPPTEQDNCFIVFEQLNCSTLTVCTIRDGSVFQVNSEEELGYSIIAMASFKGMIYGITDRGLDFPREFVTIHVVGECLETRPLLMINGHDHLAVPEPYLQSWVTCEENYLIESPCGNELLLVTKMLSSVYQQSGVRFRVFRADVINRTVCEELEDLDGTTVFIGYYGNGFCCSYSESFGIAIKPNSIYYIDSRRMAMHVYDLGDRSTTTLLPRSVFDLNTKFSTSFWVDLPRNILDFSGLSS